MFLGSVAEAVVRKATCPVLTVREEKPMRRCALGKAVKAEICAPPESEMAGSDPEAMPQDSKGGLACCDDGAGHWSRKVDPDETTLGKQIIFSRLVHDADQSVAFGGGVGDHSVDFAKYQGSGKTPVLNAHHKARIGGLVVHGS